MSRVEMGLCGTLIQRSENFFIAFEARSFEVENDSYVRDGFIKTIIHKLFVEETINRIILNTVFKINIYKLFRGVK